MANGKKVTDSVKSQENQRVGPVTGTIRSEILQQAASLGLLVVEYLLSDEGHKPTVELRMADEALSLKEKLEEWNGF